MASLLIVEDQAQVRRLLVDYFEEAGFRVRSARDGCQALDALRTAAFDGMLIDLHMPGLNGLETIRQIRRGVPSTAMRIILMSGDFPLGSPEEVEDVGFLIGAHATVYKPFDLPTLLGLVQEQLILRPYTSPSTFYVPAANQLGH